MTAGQIEKFTPSQDTAIQTISEFLKKPIKNGDINSRVIVLIGPAGSGKTTIVKYILEDLLKKDVNVDPNTTSFSLFSNPNVVGVALAHKAKQNLTKSIPLCKTFASFFGMKEVHGPEGQRYFEADAYLMSKALCRAPIKVVVHDEVSMYDKGMIDLVLNETHYRTKIILMGDAAQLPPINTEGDEDSPAFVMFNNVVELKERVRQTKGNPILELSDVIREEIFGNQDLGRVIKAMKKDTIVNGSGFKTITYSSFLKDYKNSTTDYMESKVIAYRRDTVSKYNLAIRGFIYNNCDKMFIPGEIVYMNDTFVQNDDGLNNVYYCYNSDEYRVLGVEKDEVEEVAVYKIFFSTESRPDLQKLVESKRMENPYFVVVSPEGQQKYNDVFIRRRQAAFNALPHLKSSKWSYFYDFKNRFADCSYGYALTGHKAQGSGYKNIYVDVNDILTVGPISTKRKLQALYTAITRATHNVTFLKRN